MGKVTVQRYTIDNPISLMGEEAGICWGAGTSDEEKNFRRGLHCLRDGHGRVEEYVQIFLTIEDYSARVIRELYTHIGGAPTRLQESTRYVDCTNFTYMIPSSIDEDSKTLNIYNSLMKNIKESYAELEEAGVPKEDIANILPLGMHTKIVLRTNLRNLIDMAQQRLYNRAYWEYQDLMDNIIQQLSYYSDEWDYLVNYCNAFKRKCEVLGYCPESDSCGYMKNA